MTPIITKHYRKQPDIQWTDFPKIRTLLQKSIDLNTAFADTCTHINTYSYYCSIHISRHTVVHLFEQYLIARTTASHIVYVYIHVLVLVLYEYSKTVSPGLKFMFRDHRK